MQFDRSPAEVWRRYERDRDYKRSIGLYDRVRRNEAFYLGRQWEGLRVQSLDPLIFNAAAPLRQSVRGDACVG